MNSFLGDIQFAPPLKWTLASCTLRIWDWANLSSKFENLVYSADLWAKSVFVIPFRRSHRRRRGASPRQPPARGGGRPSQSSCLSRSQSTPRPRGPSRRRWSRRQTRKKTRKGGFHWSAALVPVIIWEKALKNFPSNITRRVFNIPLWTHLLEHTSGNVTWEVGF